MSPEDEFRAAVLNGSTDASLEELARLAFEAKERLAALELANTPTDYKMRELAFIAIARARAESADATRELEQAINSPVKQWARKRHRELTREKTSAEIVPFAQDRPGTSGESSCAQASQNGTPEEPL